MSDRSPLRADPNRTVQTREWYLQNTPGANRLSWRLHLCVSSQVIDDFVPQVKEALHAAALAGRPVNHNSTWEALCLVTERLSLLRPDIDCPELPFKAFANVIQAMALKFCNEEPSSMRPEHAETQLEGARKRKNSDTSHSRTDPDKTPRLSYQNSFFHDEYHDVDADQENPTERKETLETRETSRKERFRDSGDLRTITASRKRIPTSPNTHLEATKTTSIESSSNFDPDLVTISIMDAERIGNIHIIPLKSIVESGGDYDTRTCAGVRLHQIATVLGLEVFDPYTEQLWCEIDDIEHRITSEETFQILCRWQIEDHIARSPSIPPRIRFEKRQPPAAGSSASCQETRLQTSTPRHSSSHSTSSSLWTRNVTKSTSTKGNGDQALTVEAETVPAMKIQTASSKRSSMDSDGDRPLLQSLESSKQDHSVDHAEADVSANDQREDSSSPLSAIVVFSKPMSQRRSTMSSQLLEDFQKPLLPTPSADTQDVSQGDKAKKKKKSKK